MYRNLSGQHNSRIPGRPQTGNPREAGRATRSRAAVISRPQDHGGICLSRRTVKLDRCVFLTL
jgi:hypothetical protein